MWEPHDFLPIVTDPWWILSWCAVAHFACANGHIQRDRSCEKTALNATALMPQKRFFLQTTSRNIWWTVEFCYALMFISHFLWHLFGCPSASPTLWPSLHMLVPLALLSALPPTLFLTNSAATHLHVNTHTHTHLCMHACTHASTHARMHASTHLRTHPHTHTHTHARTHARTRICTRMHKHACKCLCTCSHA